MIRNDDLVKVIDPVLSALMENENCIFYLTGSRFFGGARPDSDYDFFASYDLELRWWLSNLGFQDMGTYEEDTMVRHMDDGIATVMRYKNGPIQVDIQLVKNVENRLRVRSYLYKTGRLRTCPKELRSSLWDMANRIF